MADEPGGGIRSEASGRPGKDEVVQLTGQQTAKFRENARIICILFPFKLASLSLLARLGLTRFVYVFASGSHAFVALTAVVSVLVAVVLVAPLWEFSHCC